MSSQSTSSTFLRPTQSQTQEQVSSRVEPIESTTDAEPHRMSQAGRRISNSAIRISGRSAERQISNVSAGVIRRRRRVRRMPAASSWAEDYAEDSMNRARQREAEQLQQQMQQQQLQYQLWQQQQPPNQLHYQFQHQYGQQQELLQQLQHYQGQMEQFDINRHNFDPQFVNSNVHTGFPAQNTSGTTSSSSFELLPFQHSFAVDQTLASFPNTSNGMSHPAGNTWNVDHSNEFQQVATQFAGTHFDQMPYPDDLFGNIVQSAGTENPLGESMMTGLNPLPQDPGFYDFTSAYASVPPVAQTEDEQSHIATNQNTDDTSSLLPPSGFRFP